jgi:DNA-binding NarL/FixJ family response regulator
MTPGIASKVLQLFKKYIPQKNNDYALTKREIEILSNLVEGLDNQQIADKLFISIQTVRNHIRHIYEKLQVHSKSQAVVKALRESLI